ncbi:MAG TPA: trigger factor [Gammaproteobacteria bacterium]|nr:trigger factor [Gammaproteobacteria bacterium]
MEVTETKVEGLSRSYQIRVTQNELSQKLDARIKEIQPQMRLKGFRPGKVPPSHIKKMFGKSLMGEMIDNLVKETNEKAIEDAQVRPASQPHIHLEGEIDDVIEGKADLAYEMHLDVMPEFEPVDPATLEIERPVAEIPDEEIEEALGKLAEQNMKYEPRGKTAKARDGDAVVIDFVGKIDGEAFEGGSAEGATVVIGQGRFIPGFEEQLVGVKAGEEKDLNVTFPEDYSAPNLAGKEAVFEVKVEEVRAPQTPEVDEEFATGLGLESLEQLKDLMTQQIRGEYDGASRAKAKRKLLDALDKAHDFELPAGMVNQEFNQIWAQFEQEKEAGRLDEEEANKPEDELKEEYQRIAARRVRLGLVLAEIGRKAEVTISEQEVQQALIAEARKFPGQERQVVEFFQKNPDAMAQLRAPIYEDKVVDHILAIATVNETTVSKDELFAEDEGLDSL